MKRIIFSSLFLVSQLAAIDLNPKGYLRGMYLGDPDGKASAIGGSVEITPKADDFYADVAFFNSTLIGSRQDGVTKLFASSESGYSILGVAAIGYKKGGLDVLVGRQRVITPLVDMDDGRIVPNLYEGASAKYAVNEKAKIEAYYLTRMSGFWATIYGGEDMSKFVSMSKGAGYGNIVSNAALMSLGGTYDSDFGKISLWGYHSKNLLNLYYGEYSVGTKIDSDTTATFAIQGTSQSANGTLKNYLDSNGKNLNQQYAGVKIGAVHKATEIYVAAAKVNDSNGKLDKNMMNVWAGIPQYTVFNEHVMKSFDTDGAKLYKGFLGHKFSYDIEASASHIYVDSSDKRAVADISVTQLSLSKQTKNFSVNGIALLRRDGGDYTRTILKSTIEYRF
ncbi:MAG: hypothetical protein AB7D29_08015 [Campylobacterales bacterium]